VAKKRKNVKKGASRRQKVAARKKQNAIQRFVRETVSELRRVSWPTREEAKNLTGVVIIVMVVMSAFLGSLDLLFTKFFEWLLG
jgi:preprotein translocase subunit SecE